MKFGLHLGTRGIAADPDNLAALAQQADRLGLSHLGFSDHVVFTRSTASVYPYSESGKHPVGSTGFCLEQLSCLTYAAALTRNVRLLTSVMVVPHRPPLLAAKTLATIDVLSKGRLTVGIGVGWLAEEMAALGAPPYEKRGAASDEYIRAFRELWSEAQPTYEGAFVRTRDVVFEPKPVQRPGPPIWVGGEGPAARRRAGRIGDGWYPTIRNPKEPLDTPEALAAALADVRGHAEAAGRDPAAIDVVLFAPGYSLGTEAKHRDGRRVTFTGSAEQIAGDARAYAAAGVCEIVVGFESNELQDALDRIEGLARDVMPLVR
jgi:probable F420-dependent oxidoreductase